MFTHHFGNGYSCVSPRPVALPIRPLPGASIAGMAKQSSVHSAAGILLLAAALLDDVRNGRVFQVSMNVVQAGTASCISYGINRSWHH